MILSGESSPLPAWRTTSRSGQNVMPSPYGRHRPVRTCASPAEPPGELLDQPRLPESGLADHGDGHGHSLTGGPGVRRLEATYLFATAHQRRVETDGQGTQAGVCGPQEEPIGTGAVGFDGSRSELLGLAG